MIDIDRHATIDGSEKSDMKIGFGEFMQGRDARRPSGAHPASSQPRWSIET
ncbi:hypothetical protein [Acidiphilium sp. 20-67-58]|uniref:hypothetical protein n=1 Tax=Acidiphilium sp. 20-67-58 TaxID=1970291 RepID=UPI0025BBB898|nr:hypothetical protein [Acidiphilium sp. 20-67-58]